MHDKMHPLSNKTVKLNIVGPDIVGNLELKEQNYWIEDWWDHLTGKSWVDSAHEGNPAAIKFLARTLVNGYDGDIDEVVYGKVGSYGHLVHISEIGNVLWDGRRFDRND